jgi:hypothetical protein
MKIHAYKVIQVGNVSLAELFAHVVALPLDQRLKRGFYPLRIEDAVPAGNFWMVDFTGIHHEGPGKASAATPVEDFDLADEEGYGHETAMCFDSQSEFMTLQYNHYGPRMARIQTYLYQFARLLAVDGHDPNLHGFGFTPVLKPDAAERLNHLGIVKNIDISFYVPGVRAQPNEGRQSLNSLLDSPLVGSSERIRLQLSASRMRGTSLAVNHVKSLVTDLLGVRDEVYDLKITAQENEDAPKEPVDFIEARLEADIPVVRAGRRYGRPERWAALRQAFDTWAANGQFA